MMRMMKAMVCKMLCCLSHQKQMRNKVQWEGLVFQKKTLCQPDLRHCKPTATATVTSTLTSSSSEWPKKTEFGTLYRIGIDEIPTGPTETPLSQSAEERSWVFFQQRCITRSSSSSASASASKSSSRYS